MKNIDIVLLPVLTAKRYCQSQFVTYLNGIVDTRRDRTLPETTTDLRGSRNTIQAIATCRRPDWGGQCATLVRYFERNNVVPRRVVF
jgi:hypothetical protein